MKSFIEIGHAPYFKHVAPDSTVFISVGKRHPLADFVIRRFDIFSARQLMSRITAPHVELVLCRINNNPHRCWSRVRNVLRIFKAGTGQSPPPNRLHFNKNTSRAPLVILDFEDEDYIHPDHQSLLAMADLIFKRELPVDRWRLLRPETHSSINEPQFRSDMSRRALIEKLRPLPLGLPLNAATQHIPKHTMPKTVDVFFAGETANNAWMRQQGRDELGDLANSGYNIDLPANRLDPLSFYNRCAAAWLVWSPAGYGWDCFRHYEAAACGSVPLMPYPNIERHAGFVDGLNAVFYDPRPGGLMAAVKDALQDKARLMRMAEAARQLVAQHYTPAAIMDYVVKSTCPHV